ncbi:TadE/TadG family type IV pilus assembly protein [Cellulomonas sp. KRMCY2]|uniref:TadE/TadG family type IV pilus assembly protein n=1 Tax=Cellulomonas sp. KRMCY2 TaxID=1304865 RepID=UPI00045EBE02|nr:TadE/TadG family type IV pilus assembly protein [Cellulomonas sp. KRMCY2]
MSRIRSVTLRVARTVRARAHAALHDAPDRGSAIVEFLGVALVLLVPVVYLVLVLARMQSAAFAVDGAAREAARAFVTAQEPSAAAGRAVTAAAIAFDDQGLDPAAAAGAVVVACSADPCLTPGTAVTATIALDVPLPGVPGWLQGVVPLAVPVSATATATVDTFAGAG